MIHEFADCLLPAADIFPFSQNINYRGPVIWTSDFQQWVQRKWASKEPTLTSQNVYTLFYERIHPTSIPTLTVHVIVFYTPDYLFIHPKTLKSSQVTVI